MNCCDWFIDVMDEKDKKKVEKEPDPLQDALIKDLISQKSEEERTPSPENVRLFWAHA